ncbi:MAG: fibronectin type III domain-containing protein [Clostridia bacterium]|nr:fibronectin type III domain-containing protein [Clostridia bacterium]
MNRKLRTALLTAFSVLLLAVLLALPASAATSISKAVVTYTTSHSYTGSYIKPKVTVKVNGKKLSSKSYTVTYKNNKSIGTATLTVKGKGNYNGSVTKKFYITPASPKKLKAAADVNSVKLSWKKVSGATSYQVYMYNSSTGKWVKKATVKATSVTIKKLQPGTIYKFRVRAYTKSSKALYSPYSSLTVKTKVAKVSSLKAVTTANSVKLSWAKVKNATGYQVYMYDTANKKWVRKKTLSANSVTISGLKGATSYKFKVRARNTLNKKTVYGTYSNELTAITKPAAVRNVQVTSFTSTTATIKWDAVTRATGYDIYVGKTADPSKAPTFTKVKTTTATSYKVTGLDTCCYYTFRIGSRYKTGGKIIYGDYLNSNSKQIFTPVSKVTNIDLKVIANTYATMTWTAQPYSSGYYVYLRKDSDGTVNLVDTLPASKSSYTFKALEELTAYRFFIRAYYVNKDGSVTLGARDGISAITDDGKVESVAFTKAKSSLGIGSSYVFKASVIPSYADNKKITFSSSNKAVATIDSDGRVTAISTGTAKITVTSDEGGFTDTVTVNVVPVKSTAITVPSKITAYMNESTLLTPTFTPTNTTNKAFTITGSDYTYSYAGLFGITQKATCKFSDYVTVTSSGQIIPKKLTVEPETGEEFSFTVTVKATDSGVTDTAKLTVRTRPIKISLPSNDIIWECGSNAKLNVTVSDDAGFTKNQLIWQSSNNNIAYVDSDGTVYGTGTGEAVITAWSPDKSASHSITIFVRPKITVSSGFYSDCLVGDEYPLSVTVLPEGTEYYFSSLNTDILSVDENGVVTILDEGTAMIIVSAKNAIEQRIVFTSQSWDKPATDEQSLFDLAQEKMNLVKAETPRLIRSTSSVFTNFVLSDSSSELTAADLQEMFADFANPSTTVVEKLGSDATSSEKTTYYNNVPVSGSSLTVLSGLELNALQSIKYVDGGSSTYDIVFTLKPESMTSPASATVNTNHGKVFDILSGSLLNSYISTLNSGNSTDMGELEVTYSGFSQYYNNSSVTVTIDKLTGNTEFISYDMNISVDITALKISMGIINALNSDLSFDVNNKVEIDVIN